MPEWKQEIIRRLERLNLSATRAAEITEELAQHLEEDRKSTRLNSSHVEISYAVCSMKKKQGTDVNLTHQTGLRTASSYAIVSEFIDLSGIVRTIRCGQIGNRSKRHNLSCNTMNT